MRLFQQQNVLLVFGVQQSVARLDHLDQNV